MGLKDLFRKNRKRQEESAAQAIPDKIEKNEEHHHLSHIQLHHRHHHTVGFNCDDASASMYVRHET